MAGVKDPLSTGVGFEWDYGNAHKNWGPHRVTPEEAEDIFFNQPFVVGGDTRHSKNEKRHYALGRTEPGRLLFVAVTIRESLLGVISARDMNRQERDLYAKHEETADT